MLYRIDQSARPAPAIVESKSGSQDETAQAQCCECMRRVVAADASKESIMTFDEQFEADLLGLAPYIRGFAVRLCGRNLAEDMAQETLTRAWRARNSFRSGTQMKAWLFTILRNEYRSHLRRAWRQVAWNQNSAEKLVAPPLQQHWQSELSDVQRALPRLSSGQREALMLVAVSAYSYEQASVITSTPVGTVKSRVARGRARLVKLLEGPVSRPDHLPESLRLKTTRNAKCGFTLEQPAG
jgi:RNA polymerase sigma-70 factor, ECF subfamily